MNNSPSIPQLLCTVNIILLEPFPLGRAIYPSYLPFPPLFPPSALWDQIGISHCYFHPLPKCVLHHLVKGRKLNPQNSSPSRVLPKKKHYPRFGRQKEEATHLWRQLHEGTFVSTCVFIAIPRQFGMPPVLKM